MPLPIELVKAQLKVWEYKCVLIVGKPHWPYAYKTTETYTYEYAMLTPSPHKMKLVLTHHVDAHPIPYLHVEVATADKKSSYQKPDIMNKPILIGSLLELKVINERIHGGTQFPDEIRMEEHEIRMEGHDGIYSYADYSAPIKMLHSITQPGQSAYAPNIASVDIIYDIAHDIAYDIGYDIFLRALLTSGLIRSRSRKGRLSIKSFTRSPVKCFTSGSVYIAKKCDPYSGDTWIIRSDEPQAVSRSRNRTNAPLSISSGTAYRETAPSLVRLRTRSGLRNVSLIS